MSSRLTQEFIQELAPLLGSLARMIARGSDLSNDQLQIILEGAGLETELDALAELVRWGRLLVRVREHPSAQVREAVVEALFLRGLPEATVLLAIDTVAATAHQIPTESTIGDDGKSKHHGLRLAVDMATLNFGVLPVDSPGILSLMVLGGPGHVAVESDQLTVRPMQFGPEDTQVQVEVRPLVGSVLWTSIKLITAAETLEVPVVAEWHLQRTVEGNTSGPALICHTGLVVAADGSGSHRPMIDAVAAVAPAHSPSGERKTSMCFGHYLYIATLDAQEANAQLALAIDYILRKSPTVGFNPDICFKAERVTIIGTPAESLLDSLTEKNIPVAQISGDLVALRHELEALL